MNIDLIGKVAVEIGQALVGMFFRQIYQLGENRFAFAFEGDEFRLLFVSIEPRDPRIYLIRRRIRDLKKQLSHPSQFSIITEKLLGGSVVRSVIQKPNERIITIEFLNSSNESSAVVIQLTGISSNCFLLDSQHSILSAARKPIGAGQEIGMAYETPKGIHPGTNALQHGSIELEECGSISDSLDHHFQILDAQREFDNLAKKAKGSITQELTRTDRLIKNLERDLAEHGDADRWKRYGDLLLANQATAMRNGKIITVTDLYTENEPRIEINADENDTIPEAAQKYFRKYSKARKAERSLTERIQKARSELNKQERKLEEIKTAISRRDSEFLVKQISEPVKPPSRQQSAKVAKTLSGIRSYVSSDGFEILVGKKAVDNDRLTLRVARSRDTWMHAADYPGSHVVIRNADRKEIPHRTLIEAAQMAAFFSQGNKQPKAAVNYTLKKFVSKPKGAAAGLVRLASFKTILVEPVFPSLNSI